MGCFTINGKFAGAQDGGVNLNLPACYRNKSTRGRLGCDEPIPDETMLERVDSQLAGKILGALASKLDPDEMGRVLEILTAADLVTKEEARSVSEAMSPQDEDDNNDPDTAMDARLAFDRRHPGAARITQLPGGLVDDERYRQTKLREAKLRDAAVPAMSREQRLASDTRSAAASSFAARYPDASRIRNL